MTPTVRITPRLLAAEDFQSGVPGATFVATVAGLGSTTLTAVPVFLLTQLVSAANDTAAGVAGVLVGEVYYLNTTGKLRTRMT